MVILSMSAWLSAAANVQTGQNLQSKHVNLFLG
ncbi:uncharacterized protein METZ01_LOCUS4097 [marine metagenome]|uniref:Uncharacterized protein n=1 Tax=marine metagenome TaxID=408172 RepID=A0A381NCF5_9ZZZZ